MASEGRRSRGILTALVIVAVLVGCDATVPSPTPIPDIPYGTPIDAGPLPDERTCQALLRAEIGAAVGIRTDLGTPGVATDEIAARAAAGDPTTDTRLLGIPLTAPELRALKQNGLGLDGDSPMATWVNVGAPERFGGIWLEGAKMIVAVVAGDPATLALARCLERRAVSYVWANVSLRDGTAILDRIAADMDRWKAQGIAINLIDYDETKGVVNVGMTVPTPEALAALQGAYGPLVRIVQEGPAVPLSGG